MIEGPGSHGSGALGPLAGRPPQNPADVYLRKLRPTGRSAQASALRWIARSLTGDESLVLPWAQLRYEHTSALKAEIADAFAPATANRFLSALRGVLREAWRLEQMTTNDFERAIDIGAVNGESAPAGRMASVEELEALFDACAADGDLGLRDAALISLMRYGGLRRAEAVSALREHLADDAAITGDGELLVTGKGQKERTVYARGAVHVLTAWFDIRPIGPGPIVTPLDVVREITPQMVTKVLKKHCKKAGIEQIDPHDLRRTFASELLDSGVDLVTVQKLMGHSDPKTTSRYDRRGEATKKAAASKLAAPRRWGAKP